MRFLTVSEVGCPVLSRAGVNRARLRRIRQVAASSDDEPLEFVIEQAWTRPSGPTVSEKEAVPSSLARCAADG